MHSNDDLVRREIGRSVSDVTIPDPLQSDVVAMLEIQYRMHPAISDLVGRLFYGGRLVHAADRAATDAIAARGPFPGRPIAVVDTPDGLVATLLRAAMNVSAETGSRPARDGLATGLTM